MHFEDDEFECIVVPNTILTDLLKTTPSLDTVFIDTDSEENQFFPFSSIYYLHIHLAVAKKRKIAKLVYKKHKSSNVKAQIAWRFDGWKAQKQNGEWRPECANL